MTGTDLAALDFDRVLANLAEGAPTLKRACAFDGAPRPYQVLARAKAEPDFGVRLEEAIVSGADNIHDEIVQVENGVLVGACPPAAAAASLASKRWRLERIDRKRWGAQVDVKHTGNVALGLVIHDRPKVTNG
jgi:hypothetical protein